MCKTHGRCRTKKTKKLIQWYLTKRKVQNKEKVHRFLHRGESHFFVQSGQIHFQALYFSSLYSTTKRAWEGGYKEVWLKGPPQSAESVIFLLPYMEFSSFCLLVLPFLFCRSNSGWRLIFMLATSDMKQIQNSVIENVRNTKVIGSSQLNQASLIKFISSLLFV